MTQTEVVYTLIGSKEVRLDFNKWFAELRHAGYMFDKLGPEAKIVVVAVKSADGKEWAAYHQRPETSPDPQAIARGGSKLPESQAYCVFPKINPHLRYRR